MRKELDWQNHQKLGTSSMLNDMLTLLNPSQHLKNGLQRYGSKQDGGYVVHHNLALGSHLISLGVGDNISFDSDLAQIVRSITLCDFSIDELPVKIPNAQLIRKKVVAKVMDKSKEIALEELLDGLPRDENVLIKMDIEGYEWEILANFDWSQFPQVNQLVIEFHGLLQKAKTFQSLSMLQVVEGLTKTFQVVNFHANNYGDFECFLNIPLPDVIEVTLVRREVSTSESPATFMTRLNYPNNPFAPEILFPITTERQSIPDQ